MANTNPSKTASGDYPPQVRAVMNHASVTLNSFDAADWYDLALAALDQAGFSVRDQKAFEARFERPEDGTL